MDAAVNETFVIEQRSAKRCKSCHGPRGRFLRLTGSLSLTVSLRPMPRVSAPFVMSGDFAFEQVTLPDPNPGDSTPASEGDKDRRPRM
jgi:hypothetical protein